MKGIFSQLRYPRAFRMTLLGQGVAVLCLICQSMPAWGASAPLSEESLAHLSIEDLANIEITSVSKKPEPLSEAAASVYVITSEDIRRSGATSIPEMLRLAPNLEVARVDASQYAISARGFNSTTANKLLVLIDGRSVYTPLYSGVFWDIQDLLPADIDRIEVISGPGGTLWGANAVSGVINIITRDSHETQGTLVSAGIGTDGRDIGLRHGGKLGEDGSYRLTAKGLSRAHTDSENGSSAEDAWRKKDLDFRLDWGRGANTLMMEGGVYEGTLDQPLPGDKSVSGLHVLGRWNRRLDVDSSLQVQSYIDRTRRDYPGTYGEVLDTWDLDIQHRFRLGKGHDILWGGGYRFSRDDVTNSAQLAFLPPTRDLILANVFAQDSITLDPDLKLTLGTKLEHNSYTGGEWEPNARLAWQLKNDALLWTAVSRSIRAPSRIDRDFFIPGNAPFLIAGGANFQSEKITTYEVGYRAQPIAQASYSISTFYNVYRDLRSVEPASGTGPPFVLGNKMEGNGYGVEMWGNYRVTDWWRVSAGYNYLKQDLRLQADSGDTFGVPAAGNDPSHQLSLRSSMNLPHKVELDLALRKIGSLPSPAVPGYTSVDMRVGWQATPKLELSLAAFNLLNNHHAEFGTAPLRSAFGRSIYLKALWTY